MPLAQVRRFQPNRDVKQVSLTQILKSIKIIKYINFYSVEIGQARLEANGESII